MTWYLTTSGHHGLVIDESDGRTVAVAYNKDDTRLIAAAPELLEHLQTLADYLAEAHAEDKAAEHYGDEDCSYCRALDAARAAIAEATAEPVAD